MSVCFVHNVGTTANCGGMKFRVYKHLLVSAIDHGMTHVCGGPLIRTRGAD
jgi:hypothetical protein